MLISNLNSFANILPTFNLIIVLLLMQTTIKEAFHPEEFRSQNTESRIRKAFLFPLMLYSEGDECLFINHRGHRDHREFALRHYSQVLKPI